MHKTVTPLDAKTLLDTEGYRYVDVRSEAEFAAGHADSAVNIPVAVAGPMGMQPNPDFVPTVVAHFAPDAKLIVGCASGGRSGRACNILAASGFTCLANLDGGFLGRFDPMGQLVQPGWSQCELPVSTETADGASYASLVASAKDR